MSDIIHLLPDNIANQIAAGEVIQRPSSAVKELMENSIDSKATEIKVIVQDAGKNLVQIIDNGIGMTETDARMAFERHATSKISSIDDIFKIKTMGFRGEALASIAAVAQISMKTKRREDELGTWIEIENSKIVKQEPCNTFDGTSISMKNLFFNVPARRNFLKIDNVELKAIVEEFIRVALAFSDISFTLITNGVEKFHLIPGSLKQRCIQILGSKYNANLIAVLQKTDYLNIQGFVGKPEMSKKTRGEQYFFINNRFIKSFYLNHAVYTAFENLIAKDSYPCFVIFIELDPAKIDINVHPTKQEIKFEDEKIVYAFLHAAIKHSLAQFNITPSLDFSLNPEIQNLNALHQPINKDPQLLSGSQLYQSFNKANQAHFIEINKKDNLQNWQDYYTKNKDTNQAGIVVEPLLNVEKNTQTLEQQIEPKLNSILYDLAFSQILYTYILVPTENGFLVINQQYAHERIIYERISNLNQHKEHLIQRLLFPITFELSPVDAILLDELLTEILSFGYEIDNFGNNSFIIQGIPTDVESGQEINSIELILEQFKHFKADITFNKREKLIRCLTRSQSIKAGKKLTEIEMKELVEKLFLTSTPNTTISGYPVYMAFRQNDIDNFFTRKI